MTDFDSDKLHTQSDVKSPIIPPAMWVIIWLFLMWATAYSLPTFYYHWPLSKYVMAVFYLLGAGLIITATLQFKKAATTLNPMNPDRASSLVTGGLFRFSRNPIYLGLLLILIGWAVTLEHSIAYIWLPLFVFFINRYQIIPEEMALQRQFTKTYKNYQNKVRRWL